MIEIRHPKTNLIVKVYKGHQHRQWHCVARTDGNHQIVEFVTLRTKADALRKASEIIAADVGGVAV